MIIMTILLVSTALYAQGSQTTLLDTFSNLAGSKWKAEGKWSNGGSFKQEQIYEWGVGKKIVKVQTFGTVDQQGSYGLRGEGIRAWDNKQKVMRFWEFDVFGGITIGTCGIDGNSFYYEYDYAANGKVRKFRDSWTKLNEDTYAYKVGIYEGEKWESVFLEAKFERIEK
jgi:hypothetical protein